MSDMPSEIQGLSLEDAKLVAQVNLNNACDKNAVLLQRLGYAQLVSDQAAINQIQAEAKGWSAKKVRLLSALDLCKSLEDIGALLGSVSGCLDGPDALA